MRRLRRFALLFAISMLTVAPAATVLVLAAFTERTVKDPDEEQFKCYRCVFDLTMVSADEGWATGQSQHILHYQDGILQWVDGPSESEMVASSPNDVWALNYEIWRYQGKSWRKNTDLPRADSPKAFQVVDRASVVSPTDIWAVGEEWVTSYDVNGVVWHFDGAQWRRTQTFTDLLLQDISMISAGEGWAIGTRYVGGETQASTFLRYQNGIWRTVASPEGLLSAVAMISPTNGWAAGRTVSGEETLYHYDGTVWRVMDSLPNVHVMWITMLSASAGWARGYINTDSNEESVLLRFVDGVWIRVAIPEDISLYALSSLTPGDAWLVGATRTKDQDGYVHGVLLRYLDGAWQTVAIPREPVTSSDAILLRFEALLGAYVLVPCVWLITLARKQTRRPISNKRTRRVFIVWFVVLLAVLLAFAAASFLNTESVEAILWLIFAGGLALLVSFPTVYLALPLFFPGEDNSARWRRET